MSMPACAEGYKVRICTTLATENTVAVNVDIVFYIEYIEPISCQTQ